MAEGEIMNAFTSTIHEFLPVEVFVNILKKLDFKSVVAAKRICKRWKEVIEEFRLVEMASSKFQFGNRIERSIAFSNNDNYPWSIHYYYEGRQREILIYLDRLKKNYEIL